MESQNIILLSFRRRYSSLTTTAIVTSIILSSLSSLFYRHWSRTVPNLSLFLWYRLSPTSRYIYNTTVVANEPRNDIYLYVYNMVLYMYIDIYIDIYIYIYMCLYCGDVIIRSPSFQLPPPLLDSHPSLVISIPPQQHLVVIIVAVVVVPRVSPQYKRQQYTYIYYI